MNMNYTLSRVVLLNCCATAFAWGALTTAACSKPARDATATPAGTAAQAPGQRAAPGAAGQPAGAGQPASVPAPPPPRTFTLEKGTLLAVQTNHTLSTDTQAAGEKFQASLAAPIVEGDWVVAKAGSDVEGLVVVSDKGGKVKGRAELEVTITAITLTDGQRVPVTTALAVSQAKSGKKKDAGTLAITTSVGLAIGAIAGGGKGAAIGAAAGGAGGTALVLGTRGGPAEIPARTVLHFQVTAPVEIVEKK
jgi:hypothetical protein